jgi:hypothetical protein
VETVAEVTVQVVVVPSLETQDGTFFTGRRSLPLPLPKREHLGLRFPPTPHPRPNGSTCRRQPSTLPQMLNTPLRPSPSPNKGKSFVFLRFHIPSFFHRRNPSSRIWSKGGTPPSLLMGDGAGLSFFLAVNPLGPRPLPKCFPSPDTGTLALAQRKRQQAALSSVSTPTPTPLPNARSRYRHPRPTLTLAPNARCRGFWTTRPSLSPP